MEPTTSPISAKSNKTRTVFVGFAAFYGVICLCVGIVIFVSRQQIPGVRDYFPTATEISTATVTAPASEPASGDMIFKDDFSDNRNDWSVDTTPATHLEISNGKLSAHVEVEHSRAYIRCRLCPVLKSPYHLQADFSTDRAIKEMYGLAFSSSDSHSTFYAFEIATEMFYFYKCNNEQWSLYISRKTDLIKPYPNMNTLGISIDHDLITLFINGTAVDTFSDTGNSMGSGKFWPYVHSNNYTLMFDNVYAYGAK